MFTKTKKSSVPVGRCHKRCLQTFGESNILIYNRLPPLRLKEKV